MSTTLHPGSAYVASIGDDAFRIVFQLVGKYSAKQEAKFYRNATEMFDAAYRQLPQGAQEQIVSIIADTGPFVEQNMLTVVFGRETGRAGYAMDFHATTLFTDESEVIDGILEPADVDDIKPALLGYATMLLNGLQIYLDEAEALVYAWLNPAPTCSLEGNITAIADMLKSYLPAPGAKVGA